MKNAVTLADASSLTKGDIFDLEGAYVDALRRKPRDNRQGVFHPSAIGMCGRRNVYEFISAPAIKTIDPDDLEIFDMGHAVHGLVQGKLAELRSTMVLNRFGYEFEAEVKYDPATDLLYKTFGCGGTTDGLLKIWTDKWTQRGILEVKSINDNNFDKLTGPKIDHVLQAHLYCFRFDCPVMWIWYFNKNTSRRKVYPVVYKRELFDEATARLAGWLDHVINGTLPDREESFYSCPRCEYRDVCKPPSLVKIRGKNVNTARVGLR